MMLVFLHSKKLRVVPNKSIIISGVHVPFYMVGDSTYPMQSGS